jgi:hypothetical protein
MRCHIVLAVVIGTLGLSLGDAGAECGLGLRETGFNYTSFAADNWERPQSAESLQVLRQQTLTNAVILSIQLRQDGPSASAVTRAIYTPTDGTIARAISDAQSLGMRVYLKPLVLVGDGPGLTDWQHIQPADPTSWFASYRAILLDLATLAQQTGASGLLLGNELQSMTTNPAYQSYWLEIIGAVRAVYGGQIGYNAGAVVFTPNSEFLQVPFWGQLDFAGLSLYPRLNFGLNGTKADFMAGWYSDRWGQNPVATIKNFALQIGKPVMFTELGAPPWDGNNSFSELGPLSVDLEEQAQWYDAALSVWCGEGGQWLRGIFPYSWHANLADAEATPGQPGTWEWSLYNKPASVTIGAWYNLVNSDRLFAVAEAFFPQLVPPGARSQVIDGFYARLYPATNHALATQGGHFFYYDATARMLQDIGLLTDLLPAVDAAGF